MANSKRILYVSDLDGTLLNADSQISPFTATALNRLLSRDVLFSIATARTPATVVGLMSEVNLSLPVILMTGAVIYDIQRKEYLSITSFADGVVASLLATIEPMGVSPLLYYIEDSVLCVAHRRQYSPFVAQFIEERNKTPYKRFVEVTDYEAPRCGVLVLLMGDYAQLKEVYAAIQPIEGHKSYLYHDIACQEQGYLEIYPAGTSKAEALLRLARYAQADEIVAFGDNRNDLPMFEVAHRAYAMSNAVEELKACATAVIDSNTNDGVARFLLQNTDVL